MFCCYKFQPGSSLSHDPITSAPLSEILASSSSQKLQLWLRYFWRSIVVDVLRSRSFKNWTSHHSYCFSFASSIACPSLPASQSSKGSHLSQLEVNEALVFLANHQLNPIVQSSLIFVIDSDFASLPHVTSEPSSPIQLFENECLWHPSSTIPSPKVNIFVEYYVQYCNHNMCDQQVRSAFCLGTRQSLSTHQLCSESLSPTNRPGNLLRHCSESIQPKPTTVTSIIRS